ncbi:MAG: ribbon-helix-helix protein, CopG family [Thermoplasmata archaeon]|nr:ribbon-helix-helix protein, CopG family [Thermoplasmata archaeon]
MQEQVDERISVRFENKMISEIDVLVKDMGYPNRSEFLRTAVRTQINNQHQENTISVKVTPLVQDYIDKLVEKGYYLSREDALQKAVSRFFTGENMKKDLQDADIMEIVAGKKIGIDLESSTSRQIVTK